MLNNLRATPVKASEINNDIFELNTNTPKLIGKKIILTLRIFASKRKVRNALFILYFLVKHLL